MPVPAVDVYCQDLSLVKLASVALLSLKHEL
jgi:hypothetical protein